MFSKKEPRRFRAETKDSKSERNRPVSINRASKPPEVHFTKSKMHNPCWPWKLKMTMAVSCSTARYKTQLDRNPLMRACLSMQYYKFQWLLDSHPLPPTSVSETPGTLLMQSWVKMSCYQGDFVYRRTPCLCKQTQLMLKDIFFSLFALRIKSRVESKSGVTAERQSHHKATS